MPDQPSVWTHSNDLVAEERTLRERLSNGEITADEEHARIRAVEVELDQLWDLLRQRRARIEFDQDPEGASTRSESTVEGYQQ